MEQQNQPSASKEKEIDEIVLDSDSELDDDEVVVISEDSDSSDEDESKKQQLPASPSGSNQPQENGIEKGSTEEEEDEDEDEEEEDDSKSDRTLESSEENDDEGEEDEDEEEDEEEEEESDSDSVWDSFDEENLVGPSQEANEAAVLRDFTAGLDEMVAEKPENARKCFEKVLSNPIISVYHQKYINWEQEPDDKLSKMARTFVGCHKNLAMIDSENQMDHLIQVKKIFLYKKSQVLSISPQNNSQLWMDLGYCSLEKGDPSLAKYSFKRAETEEGEDALISVFFLTREYHACLEYIKVYMDKGNMNKKFIFFKEKIRSFNDHFRQFHDDLFQENRTFYQPAIILTEREKNEMEERIQIAREKYLKVVVESPPEIFEPIEIEIGIEEPLITVLTLFCDLFDRIESYSNLVLQKVHFKRWDNHGIYLESNRVIEDMIVIIEVLEEIIQTVEQNVDEEGENEGDQSAKAKELAGTVRKSQRMLERALSQEDWEAVPSVAPLTVETRDQLPPNEISKHFGLHCQYFLPLLNAHSRPSRTPTPHGIEEFFDEAIREEMQERTISMREIIEIVLLKLVEICPKMGAIPKKSQEVFIQLYRRLNRMSSNLNEEKYIELHVLMDDLGDDHGRDYVTRWHYGDSEWPDRCLALRFTWNCARFFIRETTKLEYLEFISKAFDEEEIIMTGIGPLSMFDIHRLTEKVAKVERVRSIKLYGETKMHEEVVKIMSSDIDFCSLEPSEIPIMLTYWFESLFALQKHPEAVELLCRTIYHYLNDPNFEEMLPKILEWSEAVELSALPAIELSSFGFIFSHLLEKKRKSWRLWKKIYEIIQASEGPISTKYIETLSHSSHDDALPLLSLELLMKAHEVLGSEALCVKQNHGEFLKFMLGEMAKVFEHPGLAEALLEKKNAWILSNLDEEIDQCLHCAFGKFSKRRKQMNEHCSRPAFATTCPELSIPVLTLAIPRPMPLFEDKEKLGHDAPELIASKFPNSVEISKERKEVIVEFKSWLVRSRKGDLEDKEIQWPCVKEAETELQAAIWYLMALSSYRQNCNEDNTTYCQLFLTSGRATYSNPITTSAWGMLAHTMISELFKLEEEQMFKQCEWRTMAYRIGVHIDKTIGILHFQLGNALYQTATVLKRYIRDLAADHYLMKHRPLVSALRLEAKEHFEICIQIPPIDNKIEEFQWLSFFFLAKLYAKAQRVDVIKVVDNFFEAACSCELGDFFWYPLKINIKKQGNLEPVELHYQIFNAMWKYLKSTPELDEAILKKLLTYARSFKNHKVVKSANSLFSSNPEIDELLLGLCIQVAQEEDSEDEIKQTLNGALSLVELADELWDKCYKAFELVNERFPHHKAAYRLAEMELDRKNNNKAHDLMLKGVFRRRKKEDGFFDNFIEISSPDITRSGSYEYHIERATALLLRILLLQKDVSNLLQLLLTLITAQGEKDDTAFKASIRIRFIRVIILNIESCLDKEEKSPNSSKHHTTEIIRVWQKILKYNSPQMLGFKEVFKKIFQPKIGDLSSMAAQQTIRDEMAKKPGRKRKFTTFDLSAEGQTKRPVEILPKPISIPTIVAAVRPTPSPPSLLGTLESVQLLVQNALQGRML